MLVMSKHENTSTTPPAAGKHVITSIPKSPQTLQFYNQLELHDAEKTTPWSGLIVVSDNIDKPVNAQHQTMECQNRSLHYFNSFAALDHPHLPESQAPIDCSTYDISCLLPSSADFESVLLHFLVLVGRMLTSYIPARF